MNSLRDVISILFSSPVQNMTYVAYFKYVNEAGKITARSYLDLCIVMLTALEEQQKKIEQFEANFKQIEDILSKLVDEKTSKEKQVETLKKVDEFEPKPLLKETIPDQAFSCDQCDKIATSKAGLLSHKRSHNKVE